MDRLLPRVAAAGAAAIVDRQHDVAVGGEELAIERERVLILSVRPAVDDQQRRILRAGLVARRLDDQAVDVGAVLALRLEILGRRQLQLAGSLSLCLVSWRRLRAFERVDLGELRRRGREHGEVAVLARAQPGDDAAAGRLALNRAVRIFRGHGRDVIGAIVLQQERDVLAVRRPRGVRHRAIERRHVDRRLLRRTDLRRRIRRHDDQLVHAVGGVLIVVAQQHARCGCRPDSTPAGRLRLPRSW